MLLVPSQHSTRESERLIQRFLTSDLKLREDQMPMYEYYCDKCEREVQLTLTIREHDKGPIKCPKCGGKALRPLLSTFMSQTSKKS